MADDRLEDVAEYFGIEIHEKLGDALVAQFRGVMAAAMREIGRKVSNDTMAGWLVMIEEPSSTGLLAETLRASDIGYLAIGQPVMTCGERRLAHAVFGVTLGGATVTRLHTHFDALQVGVVYQAMWWDKWMLWPHGSMDGWNGWKESN